MTSQMRKLLRTLHRFHMHHTARLVSWMARHAGRRGAFMAFLMILDALYAYSLLVMLPGRSPNVAWSIIWMAATVNAAMGIFTRRDRVQFGLAAGFKTAWALYQFQQWVEGKTPLGWVSTVVWLGFAFIVLLISSWPEEPPPPPSLPVLSAILTPPAGLPKQPPRDPDQKDG